MSVIRVTEKVVSRVVADYVTRSGAAVIDITDQIKRPSAESNEWVLQYGMGGFNAEHLRAIADHLESREVQQ